MAEAKKYYYIPIDDATLKESGFTFFKIPLLNGKGINGNYKMILWNHDDKNKITYCDFYILDLEKSVNSLREKLIEEQLIDDATIANLITVFRNECLILKENEDYIFFKNGGNGKQREREYQHQQTKQVNPLTDLDPYIPDKDYAEFIIRTVKKTVKQEDSLVRQIVYTALSKDSSNPQNLAVLAPTSEGKTHAVLETLKPFPKERLWKIGSMSPKVIIRQNGVLVDSNNEPLEPRIRAIKKEMRDENTSEEQKEELQEELNQLYDEAKILIDLTGWLFVFLEPPHPDTWNILKPILSHDDYEIEHPYVYEVQGMGFKVKKIVTRGWPACIFCSARNESKWPQWPEIQSRFLITSPNMIKQKYLEGNILIAQRKGLPRLAQQSLIVSDSDVELVKKCFIHLIEQIKNFTYNLNPVWIPYAEILGNILPSEKGTDNRIATRILDFIIIITLSRAHLRNRLEYGNESLVIADVKEDLHEVLHITQNISGMPTYKLDFFKKYVLPVYKTKTTKDKSHDETKEETIIAITTREVCEYYKQKTGKSITTNNVKETYFNEYINNGLMDYVESVINKSQYIYYPIVDLPSFNNDDEYNKQQLQLTKRSSIPDRMDDLLQHPKLLIPRNYKRIPENWLELEILALMQHPLQINKFELYNENNEKICICKFIENYENQSQKNAKLNGCFSEPDFYDFHSEIFGNMKYLPRYKEELCKRSSSRTKMDEDVVNAKDGITIDSYDDGNDSHQKLE
jgi:hypothetical protein